MENKSTFFKKLNLYIGFIGSLCSIISIIVLIYSYLNDLNIASFLIIFIIKNISYMSLFCCILCLILNHFIIPKYKVYKLDIPGEEARPSYALSSILIIAIVINLVYILIPPKFNYAKDSIIIEDLQDISESDNDNYNELESNTDVVYDTEENNLTPLQQIVEKWIIISYEETVSVNIWETLSDEELYYIRNGIFAYSHAKFDENFYDIYSWYDGIIDINDFDWNVLNTYQVKNIENILAVENKRKHQ